VALAAGFGLQLDRCDAEIFEAVHERLRQAGKKGQRESLMVKARERLGGRQQ
jgi:hypothetical protein